MNGSPECQVNVRPRAGPLDLPRNKVSRGGAEHEDSCVGVSFVGIYVNMTDIKDRTGPILSEQDARRDMELLFYAYRDFTAEADMILARHGLGRAHHRALY